MSEVIETTGVEAQEPAEPAEPIETGAEVQEPAEPVVNKETDPAGDEPDSSKTQQDEAFAQMRREKEEAEQRAQELEAKFARDETLLGKVKSESDDPVLEVVAAQLGVDTTVLQKELEQELEEKNAETEKETLLADVLELRAQKQMEQDLAEIQKIDPNIKSLDELGDDFFALIEANMDAVKAYHATKGIKEATTATPPAQIGKVGGAGVEKDFFTKEEVEAMSPADVDKNMEVIEKSMKKWSY